MTFTIGMLGSAETSKIRSDVSVYWVTMSRDDAEFTKKRRSSKTAELHTHLEKGFMWTAVGLITCLTRFVLLCPEASALLSAGSRAVARLRA